MGFWNSGSFPYVKYDVREAAYSDNTLSVRQSLSSATGLYSSQWWAIHTFLSGAKRSLAR